MCGSEVAAKQVNLIGGIRFIFSVGELIRPGKL